MKKHYLIYQITNNVNGKIYIGKHETFHVDDDYFGSGKHLKRAIKKYGLENFTKTILIELQNAEEMNLLEKLVVTPEFCAREDVYNINVGGDGGWMHVNKDLHLNGNKMFVKNMTKADFHNRSVKANQTYAKRKAEFTEEQILAYKEMKRNIANRGFVNSFLGKHHTEETKQKLRGPRPNSTGSKNSQFGTMWICNDETFESKKIKKTDEIPVGWRKGRICKNKLEQYPSQS